MNLSTGTTQSWLVPVAAIRMKNVGRNASSAGKKKHMYEVRMLGTMAMIFSNSSVMKVLNNIVSIGNI